MQFAETSLKTNTMVVKRQELVCLDWASRKSEWENLTTLKTATATAVAANLAAKNYYRLSFDDCDGATFSNRGLKDHLPEAKTLRIAATEDFLNNNVLKGSKATYSSDVGDLIILL